MKKLLSVLLAVVLLISAVPLGTFAFTVSAATSGTTGDCTWTLDDTVLTISGNGAMDDYANSNALPWGTGITSVVIEDGVISIGDRAFVECSSLASVKIGDGVISIGVAAFYGCRSLTSITIPDSVANISDSAFYDCDGLTNITIPDSVTSIGDGAFGGCNSSLANINVSSENETYSSIKGVLFDKDATTLIQYPRCKTNTSYTIPNGTTSISDWAFDSCSNIKSITIPNSVTSIGLAAFEGCVNLKSIIIPDSVTSIGAQAFYGCNGLKNITIPDSITGIGPWTFYDCTKLKSITIPDSVTSIDYGAFGSCHNLSDVWYTGNQDNKSNIVINNNNNNIINADWHYIDNYCDTVCNECGEIKENAHIYSNNFDTTCNICAATREVVSYPDVAKNAWYIDAVRYVSQEGIMTGYGGTNLFGTADNIQRQDFVVILARLAGVDLNNYVSSGNYSFADVPSGAYYEKAILWAADVGITTGYAGGTKFGVGDKITREQLVTFLYRYAKYINGGVAPTVSENAAEKAAEYADFAAVTDYAMEAVIWALDNGVIKGQGGTHIAPGGNALRCEVAQIIYNIYLNDIF